jgi:hypothetical protein
VRPELARAYAECGNLTAARAHVGRCAELVGGGEDWRARAGHVDLAGAVVLAAEDRREEAAAAFGRARATFQRYRLPADEAEVLREWGRALGRVGGREAAGAKGDEALEILRRHGAGRPWLERVEVRAARSTHR